MIGILLACSPPLDGSSFTCPRDFPPIEKVSSADSPTYKEKEVDYTTHQIRTEIWRYEFKDPT